MRLLFFNKQAVFNYSSLILKLSSHIFCKTNSSQLFTCHLLIIICRPVSITLGCLYIFFPLSSLFVLQSIHLRGSFTSLLFTAKDLPLMVWLREVVLKMCMSHWSSFCVFWLIIFYPATDIQYFPSLNPLSMNNWALSVKHWIIYVSSSERVSF